MADPGRPVPGKPFQKINNRMKAVIICHNVHSFDDHPVTGQPVILFQIQGQVVHIRICHLNTSSLPWHFFLNINLTGHLISADGAFQAGIMVQHMFAILDRLPDPSFLRYFQRSADLFCTQHFIFYNLF